MLWRIALLVLAVILFTACGPRPPPTAYDPCEQMKADGEEVATLQKQIRALEGEAYPDPDTVRNTEATLRAESLLVAKESVLILAVQGMERSSMDCAARQRPFDRYRTPDEIEDRR